MPIAGEVSAINEEIESNPEVINSDAYGAGWLIKVNISDVSQLDGLMSAEAYQELIG